VSGRINQYIKRRFISNKELTKNRFEKLTHEPNNKANKFIIRRRAPGIITR